jgi:DNA primase
VRLADLRRLVSIEEVLRRRGLLDGLARRGTRLVGPCPVHRGDNPGAFVADTKRGLWNCFTHCKGGDVVDLVRALDGVSCAEAARVLRAIAGSQAAPPPPAGQEPASRPEVFRPFTRRLVLDPEHPFLAARGIRAGTARRFEVGAWHGQGMLQDTVAVRLHDPTGQPLGYAGRRLQPDARGKWVLPPRLPKGQILYGWHCAARRDALVVVEGPWEVLRLHQLGVAAIALLGTSLSQDQRRLLAGVRCTVLLDGDRAGRIAARRVAQQLGAPWLDLPDDRDPADLDDDLLAGLVLPLLL